MEKVLVYRSVYLPNLDLMVQVGATKTGVAYISTPREGELQRFFKGYEIQKEPEATEEKLISERLSEAEKQLLAYDQGTLREFELPLHFVGTAFQQEVWHALKQQPYGTLTTYSELAEQINHPQAIRAVANAVGRNPLLVVVPCHRVIGKNGRLTGFRSGLSVKRSLLIREGISEFR